MSLTVVNSQYEERLAMTHAVSSSLRNFTREVIGIIMDHLFSFHASMVAPHQEIVAKSSGRFSTEPTDEGDGLLFVVHNERQNLTISDLKTLTSMEPTSTQLDLKVEGNNPRFAKKDNLLFTLTNNILRIQQIQNLSVISLRERCLPKDEICDSLKLDRTGTRLFCPASSNLLVYEPLADSFTTLSVGGCPKFIDSLSKEEILCVHPGFIEVWDLQTCTLVTQVPPRGSSRYHPQIASPAFLAGCSSETTLATVTTADATVQFFSLPSLKPLKFLKRYSDNTSKGIESIVCKENSFCVFYDYPNQTKMDILVRDEKSITVVATYTLSNPINRAPYYRLAYFFENSLICLDRIDPIKDEDGHLRGWNIISFDFRHTIEVSRHITDSGIDSKEDDSSKPSNPNVPESAQGRGCVIS